MLVTIPLLFFVVSFLALHGIKLSADLSHPDWRGTFLQTCLLWGALTTIFTELLSLFGAISLPWLAALWSLAIGIALLLGWRRGALAAIWIYAKRKRTFSWRWIDGFLLVILSSSVIVLFLVAWRCPPNTTDSLQYHMSRVVHWVQNSSLRHYATYFQPQLFNPIWAETAILNLRTLWGDDRLANMVQWFSMVGSLVGVSALAGLLGVKRGGQWLAAFFAVSVPMGILQATSTQTDYVVTLWLICLLYFVLLGKWRHLKPSEWASVALATGLGMLTKGTFYLYAFPILLWLFVPFLLKSGLKSTVIAGMGFAVVVILLNLGFWVRNVITFGGPLGPKEWVSNKSQASLQPQRWMAGIVKQTALNLPTPVEGVNEAITSTVQSIDRLAGKEDSDFGILWSWNHEDLAGNPLHLMLAGSALIILLAARRRKEARLACHFALIVLSSFLFFSAMIGFDIFGVRHHLPFFVISGAYFGAAISVTKLRKWTYPVVAILVLASIPYLLLNRSRPLVDWRPRTMTDSVFQESPTAILFANWTYLRRPFLQVAEEAIATGCQEIGLRIDSGDLEYAYWWLLEAPQSGIRIEVVDTYPRLERYLDPGFKPCAIICSVCWSEERLYGLPLQSTFEQGIKLFAGPGYVPIKDG